jgi:SAM-dependent methyltransferase
VLADEDVRLPFDDAAFDVVLSCGVLEHVPDEVASAAEIARVLRPGGLFVIFQLPNQLSVVEWLSERLIGVAHDRRYWLREVRALLDGAGFTMVSRHYGSMVPKNLDRLPFLRRLFDRHYRLVAAFDRVLLRIPGSTCSPAPGKSWRKRRR